MLLVGNYYGNKSQCRNTLEKVEYKEIEEKKKQERKVSRCCIETSRDNKSAQIIFKMANCVENKKRLEGDKI